MLHLLENTIIPAIFEVRRTFDDDGIRDVPRATLETLDASNLASLLPDNGEIAVCVGSRGIAGLSEIVPAVIGWFKARGTRPFIVPAMGSHGGATAEGQREILRHLGITEESCGCPIRSSMDTARIGVLDNGLPVYMDVNALAANGIFVINRVKPHTSFSGTHESGIVKMLAIGLGKQKGADSCHALGYGAFNTIMPAMATVIFTMANVLGGLAIVENAYDKPCLVEAVSRENFIARDASLQAYAKKRLPSLPVNDLDVLLVHRMGKEIAGTGMDSAITGRASTRHKEVSIAVSRVGALRLTPASEGNAAGVGMADVIPKKLFDSINFNAMYANAITAATLKGAFCPVIMPHDRAVLQCLIKTCNTQRQIPRLAYLRDTLTLDRFWVTQPLAEELSREKSCTVASRPEAFIFDQAGSLTGPEWA